MELPTNIPSSFYTVVGVLILANFGTLITLLSLVFRAGMFVSATKNGINDAKSAAIRAHKRIDKLEEENQG